MKVSNLFFTVWFAFSLLIPTESCCQENKLEFLIEIDEKSSSQQNTLVLNLIFKNVSDEAINILDHFTPYRVFFSTTMQYRNGKPLGIEEPIASISLSRKDLKYITINPNETHIMKVNLIEFLNVLEVEYEKGAYSITICYKSHYGQGERGKYCSEPIEVIFNEDSRFKSKRSY